MSEAGYLASTAASMGLLQLKSFCNKFMINLEKENGATSMCALKQPIRKQYYLVNIGNVLCYQFEKTFLMKAKVRKNA